MNAGLFVLMVQNGGFVPELGLTDWYWPQVAQTYIEMSVVQPNLLELALKFFTQMAWIW